MREWILTVAEEIDSEEHLGHAHLASRAHRPSSTESSTSAPASRKPSLTSPSPYLEILHESSGSNLPHPGCPTLAGHCFRILAPSQRMGCTWGAFGPGSSPVWPVCSSWDEAQGLWNSLFSPSCPTIFQGSFGVGPLWARLGL